VTRAYDSVLREPFYSDTCCNLNDPGCRSVGRAMGKRIAAAIETPR